MRILWWKAPGQSLTIGEQLMLAGGMEEVIWKWALILFNRAVFLLGCWPWAGIPPDGARLAKLFPWQSSGLHIHAVSLSLHLSLRFTVKTALWVLSGTVLRGGCIISHDLLVCWRGGYRFTVTCNSEILQLPPGIKEDVTYFPVWLGEIDGSTDEALALWPVYVNYRLWSLVVF